MLIFLKMSISWSFSKLFQNNVIRQNENSPAMGTHVYDGFLAPQPPSETTNYMWISSENEQYF